jgi:transcription antitermination factor NusG
MKANINPDLSWFVATFRPRKSEDAMHAIRKAGFDVYLPRSRIERWSKRGHCYVMEHRPAMPPYIFVGFAPDARHFGMVRDMEEVGGFLGVNGEPCPVPADVVEAILVMETEMQFDNTPASRRRKEGELDDAFPKGTAVQLVADLESVFADMQGEVLGTNGRDKVHVRFGMMKSWLDRKEVRAA